LLCFIDIKNGSEILEMTNYDMCMIDDLGQNIPSDPCASVGSVVTFAQGRYCTGVFPPKVIV